MRKNLDRIYKSHVEIAGTKIKVKNYPGGKCVWKRKPEENGHQIYEHLTDWFFRHLDYKRQINNRLDSLYWSNIRQHMPKSNPKFVTYTFRDTLQDIPEAWRLWNLFRRRFNEYVRINLKYIIVLEFQNGERKKELLEKYKNDPVLESRSIQHMGCIHFHVIYFNLENIPIKKLSEIWGHGFVDIKSVHHKKNGENNKYMLGDMIKYLNCTDFDIRIKDQKIYSSSRDLIKPTIKTYNDCISQPDGVGYQTNACTYDSKMDGRVYKYDFYQAKKKSKIIV